MSPRFHFPAYLVVLVLFLSFGPAFGAAQETASGDGIALSMQGSQFTVSGKPAFLCGISYYGALGASEESIRQDLADMKRHGFNWLRVWATWASFSNDVSAVDSEGGPREPFLKKLQWLVAECDRQNLVVDVTLSRGNGVTGPPKLQSHAAHRRAMETIVTALKPRRNWYLDLSNERNIRDQRFTSIEELGKLREAARTLDPQRLVTASHAGDLSADDVREYLLTVRVDFLSPHRPRDAGSAGLTKQKSAEYLAAMKQLGRVVPLHYQEPFRRGFAKWEPRAEDFVTDLAGARAGGAAGWCFHNGDNRAATDGQPRRSFDLRARRLFEQWDAEEVRALDLLSKETGAAPPPAKPATESARGPLRVHPSNPRYFTDGSGKAVYLTGSHTWNNLVDMGNGDPPAPFDFDAYLDFLERHHHNFIRLWAWDSSTWDSRANGRDGKEAVHHAAPLPWARTGPGNALDGKPKFDLTKFDAGYFERLRTRVSAAGRRGIYVSVMLFEGWGLRHGNKGRAAPEGWAWRTHPFHPDNNINGVSAARPGDPLSGDVHSLAVPKVNALQSAYIRKVVDTVNDFDHTLYEVINEGGQKEWDWWVVKTVRDCERTKPKQHPVGITGHGAERLDDMLASPADWISPGRNDGFGDDPPAWNGKKVSLLDTDHVWGIGGNPKWVWKSFLRGHNPLFMDPYDNSVLGRGAADQWEPVRQAMGAARRMAARMDLAPMTPAPDIASSRYCLANPGKEYLVYLPDGGTVTVDLTPVTARLNVEWIHPAQGTITPGESASGGDKRQFKAPFAGDALLHLTIKK